MSAEDLRGKENPTPEDNLTRLRSFVKDALVRIELDPRLTKRYGDWTELYDFVDAEVKAGRMAPEERRKIWVTTTVDKENREQIDFQTGLFNKRGLMAILEVEVERQKRNPDQPLSLAYMDLDHFSIFNNKYGHDAGDVTLKAWTDFVGRSLRATDFLGRPGGEEVVAVLPNTDENTAFMVFDRITARMPIVLTTILEPLGIKERVTMSVGVVQYIPGEVIAFDAKEGLIKRADARMYQAKEAGRNRVVGSIAA